jgi:tripartite-type tricarboxylate transporter receptor subunit TctC
MRTPSLSVISSIACLALAAPAFALDKVSFEGKTIKMILPTTAGGSSDIIGRLFARFFTKYLPGNAAVVVQNMPGGHGITALNLIAQQTKPDGLTMLLSSNSEADPINFRTPQAHYDPSKFEIVGGVGFGDNVMIIRVDAVPRLLDKSKPPISMGSVTGAPRGAMRMTIWGHDYLGWNTKWVTGYPGSSDLLIAMERGEIDMTSFPPYYLKDKLLDPKKYRILYADGLNKYSPPSGRADIDNAPKFVDAMKGKIKDPQILAAYDYWRGTGTFKWIALPPGTPANIRDTYRDAYKKAGDDPEFMAQGDKLMEGYALYAPEEMAKTIENLAKTSDEAIATMEALLPKL